MVAFSGGQGCLAVLKLIRNSLDDENNPKKVAYFPTVFIMDESGINEDNFEFHEVLELAKMFDFPIFVAHLSMVLKIGEESKGKVVTESTNYLSTSDLNSEGKLFRCNTWLSIYFSSTRVPPLDMRVYSCQCFA